MNKRKLPNDYHELAKSKGFKWLGPTVKNTATKTQWKCSKGHIWWATYANIRVINICSKCYSKRPRNENDYQKMAQSIGYKWLEDKAKPVAQKTLWECPNGHKWEASYSALREGKKCLYCSRNEPKADKHYKEIAKSRGFEWLGPLPQSVRHKTWWQCANKHKWEARIDTIRAGKNCPFCTVNGRKLPEDYKKLAKYRNIKWIGPEVKNNRETTEWQCKNNHRWHASYSNIQKGRNCPKCRIFLGEEHIKNILKKWMINFERQKSFLDCKLDRHLYYDFYFEVNNKQVLLEYDGGQHFRAIPWWGGQEQFEKIKARDKAKNKYAKEKKMILIRVSHKIKNIELYLKKELKNNDITISSSR